MAFAPGAGLWRRFLALAFGAALGAGSGGPLRQGAFAGFGKEGAVVYEEITLRNAGDVMGMRRGIICDEGQIRQAHVTARADAKAGTLVIGEALRRQLGLEVMLGVSCEEQPIVLVNEELQSCLFTEPVEIHCLGRTIVAQAALVPDLDEVILGSIPLDGMSLAVDGEAGRLVGSRKSRPPLERR